MEDSIEKVCAVLAIDGMSCGSCAARVETALLGMRPNIVSATVDFDTKLATVHYQPREISTDEITTLIVGLGYSATALPEEALPLTSAVVAMDTKPPPGRSTLPPIRRVSPQPQPAPAPLEQQPVNLRLHTVELFVEGMTCASCAARIENELRKNPHIHRISVNFATTTATVTFAPGIDFSAYTVQKAIKDVGYTATLSGSEFSSFDVLIGGMTCASCASRVENGLRKETGVVKCNVNFATTTATIEFMTSKTTKESILKAIESLGYSGTALSSDLPLESGTNAKAALTREKEIDEHKRNFIVSLVFAGPILFYMLALMHVTAIEHQMHKAVGVNKLQIDTIIFFLFSTPVVIVGRGYFTRAWAALRHIAFTMDTLIAIGVGVSYIFSLAAMITEASSSTKLTSYFETASSLLCFMLFGKLLEALAKRSTSSALVALMDLAPPNAIRIDESGLEAVVPSSTLMVGDMVKVLAGDRVPADASIIRGSTTIDEAMITGESVPCEKQPGDTVIGGTVNLTGVIVTRVERTGEDTTLSQILRVVQDAQSTKPQVQRIADMVASVFVPIVIGLSVSVFLIWLALGLTDTYPSDWRGDLPPTLFAMNFFIATVVIACPCALGLATPTAVMVGTGVGAQMGVLIKGGPILEAARTIDCVVLDKTGTITDGDLTVTDVVAFPEQCSRQGFDAKDIKRVASAVTRHSNHPISVAVDKYCKLQEGDACVIEGLDAETVAGRGVTANVPIPGAGDRTSLVSVGNLRMMDENSVAVAPGDRDTIDRLQHEGKTVALVAVGNVVCAVFALKDQPKKEAAAVMKYFKEHGTKVCMVTGDNRAVAHVVANEVGIDVENIHAEVLPQGKAEIVGALQAEGFKVAFVGDGINDSGALSKADVGIALGAGTEVAIECADAVLMHNDLRDIVALFDLSSTTVRRIRLNFVFALMYNMIALPVAAGVFFPLIRQQLPPLAAGIAMICSSLTVLSSSLLLRFFKKPDIQ